MAALSEDFGYYPIRPSKVVAQGKTIEIYDLVGKDTTLFHHSINDGESSSGHSRPDKPACASTASGRPSEGTSTLTHDDQLSGVLEHARVVFFDFDGPVCDVFARLPACGVAKQLTALLSIQHEAAGAKAAETDDPIEVLRIAHETDAAIAQAVEQALTATEVEAVAVAGPPTPGAMEALQAARSSGRAVVVVSNNSADCVQWFMELHGLGKYVARTIGRPSGEPPLMKPNPYPLISAAEQVHVDITLSTLIGDSLTDIQAAHAAGATVIGYANKPHKAALFAEAGADAITDAIQDIADVLAA
ncbi:HAD hydrolase-like protein [Streptomyces goshikiensis]|uniref:HAD hydrolase-like protein n=1 Tax=Streptomyces goshikiensis TaxID=1942 RepID=A0ABZ1RM22_9ACTN|nr:HAD family hydrolase [Streptomyces goshikiensis]